MLNYRRFFEVDGLIAVRVELPEVFDATHAEVRRWCEEDLVDGIRVDHPDGLSDPVGYAHRLRDLVGPDRLVLVEKILAPDEVLEPAMGVDGTTGYDALRLIDALDPEREPGRLTFITRMGAKSIREALPPVVQAVQDSGAREESFSGR